MTSDTEAEPYQPDGSRGWPLSKTFDLVALFLVLAVDARAIGGIISAAGFPSIHINLGTEQTNPSIALGQSDFLPTVLRLEYGTGWADLTTGLLLLGGIGLVVIPRIVWNPLSGEEWVKFAPRFVMSICVLSGVSVVAAVTNIVNLIWHSSESGSSVLSMYVAERVAALGLAALAAVLAWKAIAYVEPEAEGADAG